MLHFIIVWQNAWKLLYCTRLIAKNSLVHAVILVLTAVQCFSFFHFNECQKKKNLKLIRRLFGSIQCHFQLNLYSSTWYYNWFDNNVHLNLESLVIWFNVSTSYLKSQILIGSPSKIMNFYLCRYCSSIPHGFGIWNRNW